MIRRSTKYRVAMAAALAALLGVTGAATAAQRPEPANFQWPRGDWWDTSQEATTRANALLAQMTLEEKVDMLHGELNNNYGFYNAPIPRLGIPALYMTDGRSGVRLATPTIHNQRSTLLPSALAVAAAFDTGAAARHSQVATDETYRSGQNVLLAPAFNVARTPQWGRNFEGFGEDPALQSANGTQYVRTTQAYGGVMGNVQDCCVYSQETNRLEGANAVISERALQEIYARPFGQSIREGHVASVMCGFNKVNGEYSCNSDYLLNQILKTQYEFQGFVFTDYGANMETTSINRGLDQQQPGNYDPDEQPGTCTFCGPLITAVNNGTVPLARVNDSVLRILRPMFGLGLFDRSYEVQPFPVAQHNAESARIAEQSMVLLKNRRNVLPLSKRIGSLAVIGRDADAVVQGGGSSHIPFPTQQTSPLAGIQQAVSGATNVTYTPGNDPVTSTALLPGAQPIPSSFLTPTTGAAGTGLTAQYWTNQTFSGTPLLNRTDPYAGLNGGFFLYTDFNASSPHFPNQPQALDTNSSVRWTGTLTAPVTGTYQIQVVTNGKTTLTIDGNTVINVQDFFTPGPNATNQTITVPLTFTAGSTHSVQLSYVYDTSSAWNGGGAQIKLGWIPPSGVQIPSIVRAARAAANADAAVIFVRDYSTEGGDLPNLNLPNWQPDLIRAVGRANPNTVVVMTIGGIMQVSSWQDAVAGLLHAWYPGQNQGTAIARTLFGDVNPSGKLPVTIPLNEQQTPVSSRAQFPGNGVDISFREGIFEGYRGYLEYDIRPSYWFGYGLSYTQFRESHLQVNCRIWRAPDLNPKHRPSPTASPTGTPGPTAGPTVSPTPTGGPTGSPTGGSVSLLGDRGGKDRGCAHKPLQVSVVVKNVGKRAGAEVVQAYAGRLPTRIATPEKALAGFTKVYLRPGESRRVTIDIDPYSLSYWDAAGDRWVTPRGDVRIYVGTSVVDTPLRATVQIR